ncbi:MAG TPA: hypothetical protein VN692_15440 [Steroidobacteraceae bacterium]|nr:hypothetical protein [Steroidobacteraceae bacterium]
MPQRGTLSKLQLAEIQIDRAIRLYLDEADFVCAITLAGAADELLGKLRALSGREPIVEHYADVVSKINVALGGETIDKKGAISELNSARDSLKHFHDGKSVTFDFAEEAYELIDRAVSNLWLLTSSETQNMARFRVARNGAGST